MKHFNMFDSDTFEFLINLKAVNGFWFCGMINCAKKSPKVLNNCLKEIKRYCPQVEFDLQNVNCFQICKAANQHLLHPASFADVVDSSAWHYTQTKKLEELKRDWGVAPKPHS